MTPAQLTTLNALATADQTALGYIDTSGIGSNASPAVLGYEGKLSAADASQVRVA